MVEMSTYGSERARAGNRPGYSSLVWLVTLSMLFCMKTLLSG